MVNETGVITCRGRNRIHEETAPVKQVCSSRLAHAEINALLQIDSVDSNKIRDYILYTTTEPCVLCFGAIVMCGVRSVRYAASDPLAGGVNLNSSNNTFIKSRGIDIQKADKFLGEVQLVLRTDHVLRAMDEGRKERFLHMYSIDYPRAVKLGRRWFEEDRLIIAKKEHLTIDLIVNGIGKELKDIS